MKWAILPAICSLFLVSPVCAQVAGTAGGETTTSGDSLHGATGLPSSGIDGAGIDDSETTAPPTGVNDRGRGMRPRDARSDRPGSGTGGMTNERGRFGSTIDRGNEINQDSRSRGGTERDAIRGERSDGESAGQRDPSDPIRGEDNPASQRSGK